jgi:hypothetical protein
MNTITEFDILVAKSMTELGHLFHKSADAAKFDYCGEIYQAMYAKAFLRLYNGHYTPGSRLVDSLARHHVDTIIDCSK